ncbi:uncharacterized protein LOC131617133 [Vicia villosa]|uniref:uncharacterized protein LOC131617133 n=1 Tax=Vicia villosa TaxID=3911 RepID=UPI00273B879F|nr:uncharacterized protein LOC131617133 [Vicia villosa]
MHVFPLCFTDVIGVVDEIGYIQAQVGSKKQQVNFVIRNLSNNTITVMLWEAYTVQFINYIEQHINTAIPVVILIQYAKVKEAFGKYPLSVTNTYNVTKVAINEDMETIKQFAKMLTQDTIMAVSGLRSQQSQDRLQNSYTSRQSPFQKLLSNVVLLPLEQIVKLKETNFCATVATITKIFASIYGWYYQACHECPNKVTGDKPPYKCTKGHETETAIFRYKIRVDVLHAGTKCKFVLWDKESEELLEVSVAHMRETMFQAGIFDPLEFPLALDMLVLTFGIMLKS